MQTGYGPSTRRADRVLRLSSSARHYIPRERDDGALIAAMEAHLKDNPRHGFGLLMDYALRPLGRGKTRAWRVHTALKLNLPRRGKRKLPMHYSCSPRSAIWLAARFRTPSSAGDGTKLCFNATCAQSYVATHR